MIFFKNMLNLLLIIDEPFIYWINKLLRLFMIIIHIIIIQEVGIKPNPTTFRKKSVLDVLTRSITSEILISLYQCALKPHLTLASKIFRSFVKEHFTS